MSLILYTVIYYRSQLDNLKTVFRLYSIYWKFGSGTKNTKTAYGMLCYKYYTGGSRYKVHAVLTHCTL